MSQVALRWFPVLKTSDFEAEQNVQAREIVVEQRVIAVFKTPQGYFAVDGMCAHQGGPIAKGSVDGQCVTCPWHGWQYDISNGHNLLTGKQMLTTYPTEVRGDELWLAVESNSG